jgi:hypothetical protein
MPTYLYLPFFLLIIYGLTIYCTVGAIMCPVGNRSNEVTADTISVCICNSYEVTENNFFRFYNGTEATVILAQ